MQMQSSQSLTLADIPTGFFPDDVIDASAAAISKSTVAPFMDASPAKSAETLQSRTVRLSRAKTGETELRLLAEQIGDVTQFVLAKSSNAPYVVVREVLVKPGKKKTPMNEQQAVEEFELRVASAYPPEKLRNNKIVAIHLNLI